MDLGIDGKLALITGASGGIALGIAEALAMEGVRLVLAARTSFALEKILAQLPGGGHSSVTVDLTSQLAAQTLVRKFGEIGFPDIIIHNLGGSLGVSGVFDSVADWQAVWRLNVGVGIELNNLLIPEMVAKKWGRIIHVSSLASVTFQGNPAYASAKCALDGYVKSLSRVAAKDGVVVSSVAPGAVSLPGRYFSSLEEAPEERDKYFDQHLPIRRFGSAADIGGVVAFLCSDFAEYMVGSRVAVDGGWF